MAGFTTHPLPIPFCIRLVILLLPLPTSHHSFLYLLSPPSPHPHLFVAQVRVNPSTALPYWIDHINRASSAGPPIAPPPCYKSSAKLAHTSRETLPEYRLYTDKLTRLLDRLDQANGLYIRHRTRLSDSPDHRRLAESSLIEGAHVVFTTLSGAGHPSMETTEFCVTVIDEAAQCSEPSVLIPLRRGCSQCIMVGDPLQLPATIFSDRARRAGYDR